MVPGSSEVLATTPNLQSIKLKALSLPDFFLELKKSQMNYGAEKSKKYRLPLWGCTSPKTSQHNARHQQAAAAGTYICGLTAKGIRAPVARRQPRRAICYWQLSQEWHSRGVYYTIPTTIVSINWIQILSESDSQTSQSRLWHRRIENRFPVRRGEYIW
jgi:hypothetical protein